jgi:integrase/recombinase XerD
VFLLRIGGGEESRFSSWCEHHRIGQLADIEPLHVAAYIEALGEDFEKPTVQQHLAAIRMLFDWMVTGQVVATNPAHAVRGPKHVVKTGKTTVLDADQARTLLAHGPCRLSHARYASRL